MLPSFIIFNFPDETLYQVNSYRPGTQSCIQGDLHLTIPAISNSFDLPGMRHRYGGGLLKELQGRKE